MLRREYIIPAVRINEKVFRVLIIDTHLDKHSDHMNDGLVQRLVRHLNGERFLPMSSSKGYSYYTAKIKEGSYWYKLVWLHDDTFSYIGVITAFRDRRIK